MTAAELLEPRRIVALDYPNSPFKIGEILEFDEKQNMFYSPFEGDKIFYNVSVEKYPHIFRPLNWWENRKVEEMPKKLGSYMTSDTYNIEEWDIKIFVGYISKKDKTVCSLLSWKPEFGYFPID